MSVSTRSLASVFLVVVSLDFEVRGGVTLDTFTFFLMITYYAWYTVARLLLLPSPPCSLQMSLLNPSHAGETLEERRLMRGQDRM